MSSTLIKRITNTLGKASVELFRRPSCSQRLINNFEIRVKESEELNDTQWINNFIKLRNMIDINQNQLTKMNQMGPPKSERSIMEAISRRVGVEMPKPAHHQRDNIEELQYYFEKLYVPFEEYNKPPPDDGNDKDED